MLLGVHVETNGMRGQHEESVLWRCKKEKRATEFVKYVVLPRNVNAQARKELRSAWTQFLLWIQTRDWRCVGPQTKGAERRVSA